MFSYDISIVIPVYNAATVLPETIESLIKQNYRFENIQILLIDDGSSDNSGELCIEYANNYTNIEYFYKENSGVSDTRNRGIELASGEYILFLDSDDMLRENTVKSVLSFFGKHKDEVDVVAYKLELYYENEDGVVIKEHPRNANYNKQTGVYPVDKFPYLSQTTMNICLRNTEDIVKFNVNLPFCEDATFNTLNIMRKKKVGYVNGGGYLYRQSSYSSVNKYESPVMASTLLLEYAENLINQFETEKLPKYVQSIILYELRWRFQGKHLFPEHLHKDKREEWDQRFKSIVNNIDNEVIMNQPLLDKYHKFAFIRFKEKNIDVIQNNKGLYFFQEGKQFAKEVDFEIITTDIRIINNEFIIMGFIKSILQEEVEVNIGVYENNSFKLLELKNSAYSYHRKREYSNLFKSFEYKVPLDKIEKELDIELVLKVGDVIYPIKKEFILRDRLFPADTSINKVVKGNFAITRVEKLNFNIKKINLQQKNDIIDQNNQIISSINPEVGEYRLISQTKKIWLYNDRVNIADNGYFQFRHDFNKDQDIEKYYIYDCEKSEIEHRFTLEQQKNLVKFGSDEHKKLFIKAQYIFTSYQGFVEYSPFDKDEFNLILDKLDFQVVYLQHGVLHCHAPWIYSREVTGIDKFIVSSQFEKDNLVQKYLYDKNNIFIKGMPRFEEYSLKKDIPRSNKILFAPSWRSSVVKGKEGNNWKIDEEKLQKSEYFKGILEMCQSEYFKVFLDSNNLQLDIQLHPIINSVMWRKFEELSTERINFVQTAEELNSYLIFITDFSSFVFDAVYYKKPILYFIPDYDYFLCGNHSYSKLDLDIENGFGEFSQDVESLIRGINKIKNNNYKPLDKFKQRMDVFYNFEENTTENIYNEFRKNSFKLN
ncbi:glycosyltransferase [Brochothrix thermosphacta]|uniref:glycosyltransferase n=1 Tax=Brochothrix thermosphacta TaxID=2756 RepID=UPI00083FD6BA|nr:glycosyltransferase [Brochothrix thermosphacta]ODJ69336.1 hypothetical protein BFR43_11345 [Brochothrix thermosphacta]